MVTTSTQTHRADDDAYSYFSLDENAQLSQSYGWMQPIEIDDEDLMFGGKSLSAWYEEERQTPAVPVEEERRGRQRVRSHHSSSHHHHHAKSKKKTSSSSSSDDQKHC